MRDVYGGRPGQVHTSYDRAEQSSTSKVYKYMRLNHFREAMRLAQGITRTGISQEVADKFAAALDQFMIDRETLTPEQTRSVLKQIDEATAYKYVHCICAAFNPNYKPIVIKPEHFERMVFQFVAAEGPFEATKRTVNSTRKNFLNYPYVAQALCIMNGYWDYVPAFRLLKSTELRVQQDALWRAVCERNRWPFVNMEGGTCMRRDFSGHEAKDEADHQRTYAFRSASVADFFTKKPTRTEKRPRGAP